MKSLVRLSYSPNNLGQGRPATMLRPAIHHELLKPLGLGLLFLIHRDLEKNRKTDKNKMLVIPGFKGYPFFEYKEIYRFGY